MYRYYTWMLAMTLFYALMVPGVWLISAVVKHKLFIKDELNNQLGLSKPTINQWPEKKHDWEDLKKIEK